MIPDPLPSEAPGCVYAPIFGGRRIGPSVFKPSYQLVFHGDVHLFAAWRDVETWPERVHLGAKLRAAALASPLAEVPS